MKTSPLHLPRTALYTAAFILVASLAAAQSGKRLHVVSNNPDVVGRFNSLTAAFASPTVANGDTLYVIGSSIGYGDINITRPVVIVGDGYGENNRNGNPTKLGNITFTISGLSNPSGSTISNCKLRSITTSGSNAQFPVNSITLNGNEITGTIRLDHASVWILYHNLLSGSVTATANSTKVIIDHNIIFTTAAPVTISGLRDYAVFIAFNLFINSTLDNIEKANIENNIFARNNTITLFPASVKGNIFRSNVASTIAIFPVAPTDTFLNNNQGSGNLTNTRPGFSTNNDLNTFRFGDNYRLVLNSAAKGKATDGTDPGIYGGVRPFPSGGVGTPNDLYPLPSFPTVQVLELAPENNSPVQPNTPLKVKVKAAIVN